MAGPLNSCRLLSMDHLSVQRCSIRAEHLCLSYRKITKEFWYQQNSLQRQMKFGAGLRLNWPPRLCRALIALQRKQADVMWR